MWSVSELRSADRKFFNRKEACPKWLLTIVSWLPVLATLVMAFMGFYGEVEILCFEQLYRGGYQYVAMLLGSLFVFEFCLALISFFRTVFSDPGFVPQSFILTHENDWNDQADEEIMESGSSSPDTTVDVQCTSMLRGKSNETTQTPTSSPSISTSCVRCRKCDQPRPARSHHCRHCNRCVCRMDHHCPIVNNCVGHRNYKFFLLVVIHVALGCAVGICTLFFWLLLRSHSLPPLLGWKKYYLYFGIPMGFGYFFLLILFGGFHLWMIKRNLTTIEVIAVNFRRALLGRGDFTSPFDVGTKQNFHQVFGDNPWLWLLPVDSTPGDGCRYPLASQDVVIPSHQVSFYSSLMEKELSEV